jgi:anthranilate synthase/aminodeoxychorismate synthase-like glutamine amidotransferase
MLITLIDNYDSFTYNLKDYICQLGADCIVIKNDQIDSVLLEKSDAIILSPGPQRPENAGDLMEVISNYFDKKPMLGICLGHQAIGLHFGADLVKAMEPKHGKVSLINHTKSDLFENIDNPMQVMRYHSLVLKNLPDSLRVTALTNENELMAFKHCSLPLWGVQFHPESILTPFGLTLLKNWKDQINSDHCH